MTNRTAGLGLGIVGGAILFINNNLGVMFYALLVLLLLNLIAAAIKKDITDALHSWVKVISGVAIPAITPSFASTMGVHWSVANTHWLIASIFAALFAATIPDLNSAISIVLNRLHVPQAEKVVLSNMVQAQEKQIAALTAKLEAQSTKPVSGIVNTPMTQPQNPAQQ